ncbi:citrulline utilization hydrolase CtlX [Brumimicrobium aurantiacum]|uniref:Amidinotransferase n=1 Tax=Brumimicrobium aurantiacum TaxID=1737063 RepID=A0A3E1F1Q4_9FLAO|nr:arginine deiminase-related protein [Brumimicrobium aurantiacum]RFC55647.1 amidinotransferase [Brumimicrobium aurantiacum]
MQSSNNIFLVKPASFGYNAETAASNAFQNQMSKDMDHEAISKKAIEEFETMAQKLSEKGVNVLVIEDTPTPVKPDAIFPNNWGSFHADGRVILYPMLAENRREERREEILEIIGKKFEIKEIIDLSKQEEKGVFLEGTGSIIFDHQFKIGYACLASRTDKNLFVNTCELLGYKAVYFDAKDQSGHEIYHTNVMMNIGNGYAVVCLESISNPSERAHVIKSLEDSNKEIVAISYEQMNAFCGNMLELEIPNGRNILAMSQSSFDKFNSAQKKTLESYCELFPLNVKTIERIGGGSVRCMISELFLPER